MAKEIEISESDWGERSEENMRQIASDLYSNKIFCDRQLSSPSDMGMVFMPLIFAGEDLHNQLINDPPGMIFEYYDKAGPRSVNGMPIFMSCQIVSQKDTERIFEYYEKIKKANESIDLMSPKLDAVREELSLETIIKSIVSYCLNNKNDIVFEFSPPLHPDSVPYMVEAKNWDFIIEELNGEFVECKFRCKPFSNNLTACVKLSKNKDKIKKIKVGN